MSAAAGPADVFMALRDRSLGTEARGLALASELRRLLALANPERFMGNPSAQDLAREIVARLGDLHRAALVMLDADATGTSPVAAPPTGPGFVVVVGERHDRLDERVGAGDVAAIHRGRCTSGPHAGLEVAAKVALDPADNGFMLAEIEALRALQQGDARQRGQLPSVLDLFHGHGGRAGVLLPRLQGLDCAALRARFPAGLPPEHVVWIGRRLLSVVGHAHRLGVLHANIEPAHVLVRPHDHHVRLIDWCYCVIEPARTRQGFRVFNSDYSAPEVAEKKPPLPAADLYSIGRCLLYLAGGDLRSGAMPERVPDRLRRFIRYLTRESPLQRAQDAWEMFGELERVRAAVWGPHVFRELVV